ncbi:MAG: phosphatidylserine decarboxylase family protein [Bacteroidetes bacterium]|nr:phosphatidylserine decarboxylase family protein [Bacteroidota bacterium]
MKIHKAGSQIILFIGLSLILLTIFFSRLFPEKSIYHFLFYGVEIIFYSLVIRFFRIPEREIAKDENTIYCAADGKVVVIEEVFEDEYFNDKRLQVSVFMSPLNVHVNWHPIKGELVYMKHHRGKHYPAFLPKSSKDNEHASTVVKHKNGEEILIRQIAGSVARRIVTHAKVGQQVDQFEELGIIKFGSRVDLFLPIGVKINVALKQTVKAGNNIIAYFQ